VAQSRNQNPHFLAKFSFPGSMVTDQRNVHSHTKNGSGAVGDEKVYRLLGELEIGQPGQPVHLPGGASLNLLACLLVHANQRISKSVLIRAAWVKMRSKTHSCIRGFRKCGSCSPKSAAPMS